MAALAKHIDQISKLRLRTCERGASEAEAETAAIIIGRILMREPLLVVTDSAPFRQQRRQQPQQQHERKTAASVRLTGVKQIARTAKAVLVKLDDGRQVWFPLSQIVSTNWLMGEIEVTSWIWNQKKADE